MPNTELVDINLTVSNGFKNFLTQPLERRQISKMIREIDKYMFGENGSLTKSIREQHRGDTNWKPLSFEYKEWKRKMMESGEDIKDEEHPPKKVISTEIWQRTGKTLTLTQTTGKGEFKTIAIRAMELINARKPIYEVFLQKIGYVVPANSRRPLFEWTEEDIKEIQIIFNRFVDKMAKRFNDAGAKGKNLFKIEITSVGGGA